MKFLFLSLLVLSFHTAIGQVSFSGGGKILIYNSGKLIIRNPIPGGITWSSGGGIITADETSQAVLLIGETVGEYQVPFVTPGGQTIPFTYRVTTPGVGQGMLVLSSWAVSEDGLTNTLTGGPGLPAAVTTFLTENVWGNWTVQGGGKVINRFWLIDPSGYSTKPKGEYEFTYHLSEKPALLNESNLTAQRWNDVTDTWLDWLYADVANTTTKTVSVLIQNPEDQFPVWTLTDISDPLPIQLAEFTGSCEGGSVQLDWSTWSEVDNDHFVVQFSSNTTDWTDLDIIPGAGTSSTVNNYSFYGESRSSTGYYRLASVSFNTGTTYSQVIAVSCNTSASGIKVWPNPTSDNLEIHGALPESAIVRDIRSCLVAVSTTQTGISMAGLAAGAYSIAFPSGETFLIIKQ